MHRKPSWSSPFAAALALFSLSTAGVASLDFVPSVALAMDSETPNPVYPLIATHFTEEVGVFDFILDLRLNGDGVYGSIGGGKYLDLTAAIAEGGLRIGKGRLGVELGVLPVTDVVDSPYSLFLSGRDRPKLGMLFRYEGDRFFYSDRWISLNYDSAYEMYGADPAEIAKTPYAAPPWPDRCAVVKTYGLKFGRLRIGIQDAAVMTNAGEEDPRGPLFELEYFASPAPSYLIQYLANGQGVPGEKRQLNDNSLLGLFGEYQADRWKAMAQLLVDDFNFNRIAKPDSYQNPDKIAWMVGFERLTPFGRLGLYHAGATKYCFEPFGSTRAESDSDPKLAFNTMYGYTYYPDTVFGGTSAIPLDAMYIGYQNGENNLALLASWEGELARFEVGASLEFVISGAKSPTNPWHGNNRFEEFDGGTYLLDDSLLEKKLVFAFSARRGLGALELGLDATLGGVWNRLELVIPPPTTLWTNASPIWKPSNEHAFIGSLTLSARYRLSY